jgi:hypothetical protein
MELNLEKQESSVELKFEAEVVEVDEEIESQHLKTHKLLTSNKNNLKDSDKAVVFCITVDGSKHAENAFDVVTKEFFNDNSRMVLIHVYNEKQNENFNYKNKKETVVSN